MCGGRFERRLGITWLSDISGVAVVAGQMNAAKTASERVQKLRAERDALGLKRVEIYAHPDDCDKIKALAFTLNMKRQKPAKKRAG